MPKSRRSKTINLSKTEKKGKDLSIKLFGDVRAAAKKYPYIYVFEVENMRNIHLKEVRSIFDDSRIFIGKTKIMAKALGHDTADEILPRVSQLRPHLSGQVGLLLSERIPPDVIPFFCGHARRSFARADSEAQATFIVPAGIVYSHTGVLPVEDDSPLASSSEPLVRSLGMPTRLDKGKVMLDDEFVVCKKGDQLTGHQASLLKLFGVELAQFRLKVVAYYSSVSETVGVLAEPKGQSDNTNEVEDKEADDIAMDE